HALPESSASTDRTPTVLSRISPRTRRAKIAVAPAPRYLSLGSGRRLFARGLEFAAAAKRTGQSRRIAVFEVAARRQSARQPRRLHAERFQCACDVKRGRLALDGRIGRDYHLANDRGRTHARNQFLHLDVVGADAVQRRERAIEHVIYAAETARPLDCHQVRRPFHDANHFPLARLVVANLTARSIPSTDRRALSFRAALPQVRSPGRADD